MGAQTGLVMKKGEERIPPVMQVRGYFRAHDENFIPRFAGNGLSDVPSGIIFRHVSQSDDPDRDEDHHADKRHQGKNRPQTKRSGGYA
jgi:hypothetical protein